MNKEIVTISVLFFLCIPYTVFADFSATVVVTLHPHTVPSLVVAIDLLYVSGVRGGT